MVAKKRKFTEKAKVQLIKDFRASSLSASAFCKTRGLSESTFSFWKKSLTSELKVPSAQIILARKEMADSHQDFIPVALLESRPTTSANKPMTHIGPSGSAAFEMVLPSGAMIRFAVNCPPSFITAAFAAIGVR